MYIAALGPLFGSSMSLLSNVTIKAFVKNSLLSIDDLNQKYFQKWIYMSISLLIFYFVLGELVYTYWDGLNGLDALFLVTTTFSTVGYGIYAPSSTGVRLFTAAYILFGIGVGSAFIGALNDRYNNDLVIRKNQQDIENRTVNQLGLMDSFRRSVRVTSMRIDQYIFGGSPSSPTTPQEALEAADSDSNSDSDTDVEKGRVDDPLPESREKSHSQEQTRPRRYSLDTRNRAVPPEAPVNRALMDAQYSRMQAVYLQSYNEELRQLRVDTIYSFFILLFVLAIGSIFMYFMESDWTFDVAIYFSVVTLSTVGYGDVVPTTTITKIFTILYILVGCSFLARTISNIVRYPLILRDYKNEMRVLNQFGKYLSKERIAALSEGDSFLNEFRNLQRKTGEITKSEFCLSVLHLMNRVDRKHVAIISSIFDLIDVNKNGVIDRAELDRLQEVAPTEETILQMLEDEKWERINKKNPCFRALYVAANSTTPPSASSSQRMPSPRTVNPQHRDVDAYNLFLRANERKPTLTETDAANIIFHRKQNSGKNSSVSSDSDTDDGDGVLDEQSAPQFGVSGDREESSETTRTDMKARLLDSQV